MVLFVFLPLHSIQSFLSVIFVDLIQVEQLYEAYTRNFFMLLVLTTSAAGKTVITSLLLV